MCTCPVSQNIGWVELSRTLLFNGTNRRVECRFFARTSTRKIPTRSFATRNSHFTRAHHPANNISLGFMVRVLSFFADATMSSDVPRFVMRKQRRRCFIWTLVPLRERPRVFCGLADLRTNQWVFCGPKNADCVCGPVGKMRTCRPLKFQLFSWTSRIRFFC